MLISLLIIFIFFNTLLKLSFWRLWQIALWAGVLAAFLWLSYDFASEQSQTTLSQLLFPCLIYVLAQAFFFFSGADFAKTTLWGTLALVALVLLGTKGIAALLPEKDLRLEVHLLINVLIILLGLTATASAQIIYVPKSDPIDFVLLGKVFPFFLSLFVLGFAASKGYWYLKGKRNH